MIKSGIFNEDDSEDEKEVDGDDMEFDQVYRPRVIIPKDTETTNDFENETGLGLDTNGNGSDDENRDGVDMEEDDDDDEDEGKKTANTLTKFS